MIQRYYNDDVKAWIDEQDFLSEIIIEKKQFEKLLDDSVATGLDKTIQIVMDQCEFIMISTQSLRDFNPTIDDKVFDFNQTKTCQQVLKCLNDYENLKASIEKQTMEIFFSEISIRLFHLIIKNIRRLTISQTGAMRLIWWVC